MIAGVASVALVVGYAFCLGYYDAIGADWLLNELSIFQIASQSALVVVPFLLSAIVWPIVLPQQKSSSGWPVRVMLPLGLCLLSILCWLAAKRRPTFDVHAESRSGLGAAAILLAGTICARIALTLLRQRALDRRMAASIYVVWFVLFSFLAAPLALGNIMARADIRDANISLPCARAKTNPTQCTPIVAFGGDRIYCLGSAGTTPRRILVVPWSDVSVVERQARQYKFVLW